MSQPSTPSHRVRCLALVVALAVAIVATSGTVTAGPVVAQSRANLQPITTAHLVSAGRATVRALARREEGSAAQRTRAGVPGVSWDRADREQARSGDGGPAETLDATPDRMHASLAQDAATPLATTALAAAAVGGPGVVGPAWDGMTDAVVPCGSSRPCFEPPDPWVAVGETRVVQVVDAAARITTRSGTRLHELTTAALFDLAAWDPGATAADPRVRYDPERRRWVAAATAYTCSGGALFLAVSTTDDPTGAWDRYYLPFEGRWPAYPTLGLSSTLVAVGANEVGVSCGPGGAVVVGAYLGAALHVVDRDDLEDGGGAPTVASTTPEPGAFTYAPATGLTPGATLHAVVALDDGSADRADLGYVRIEGTVAAGLEISEPANLTTALGLAKLANPPTPVDTGGPIGSQHNALDLRPTDAVWLDGRLAVASTSRCAVGGATRPCARITELATSTTGVLPALRQDLRVGPSAGSTDTFMPGVGYSDDGTLWTVYSQSGAASTISSWARRQVPGTPAGAWSAGAALIAAGRGPYGGTAGAGLNERWGESVGVASDPLEPGSVWQANQLADSGGGWATRIARLGDDAKPPALGPIRPYFVAGSRAGRSRVAVRVAWTRADDGSGVSSVRLERSVNGRPFTQVALPVAAAADVTQRLAYGKRYAYRVRATDNAGNTTPWVTGPSFTPTVYTERSSRVTYRGTWLGSRARAQLGGRARHATAAGRRATLAFTGLAVAWVTTVGPSQGSARVYADGTLRGSTRTYRASTVHRRIVARRTFETPGSHTFRVEVRGTRRHPRVDVDGFIVLR